MPSVEPARYVENDPGTVMQCTEDSGDLDHYYHQMLSNSSSDSRQKKISYQESSHQTDGRSATSDVLPVERNIHHKYTTLDSPHLLGQPQRQTVYTGNGTIQLPTHGSTFPFSVVSDTAESCSSSCEPFSKNSEQGSSRNFKDPHVCYKHSDTNREYRTIQSQMSASVLSGKHTVVKPTKIPELFETKIPFTGADQSILDYANDSAQRDNHKSTPSIQRKPGITFQKTRNYKPKAARSTIHREHDISLCQFEMDNLHLQIPKEKSSISSSSSFESNLEDCIQQTRHMSSNRSGKLHNVQHYIPRVQSSLSSSDESHLDDSNSSVDSNKAHYGLSKIPNSSSSVRSSREVLHETNQASAVFCSGFIRQNIGTCGRLNEKTPICKARAPIKMQSSVSDYNQYQSSKQSSSGNTGHLIQHSAKQEVKDFSSENSEETESVEQSSWQRKKISNNQMGMGRCSPVKQRENPQSNGCVGHPDGSYVGKQPVLNTTNPNYCFTGRNRTPDIIESFSSDFTSSGYDNGSSEEELRARCIAPGCFNKIMHKESSLCIGCYNFLQHENTNSSESNASLFAMDPTLCKGPSCHLPGIRSFKWLCESCHRKLNRFIISNSDTKVKCVVSDPTKLTPHIRRDPNMPWPTFYRTPLGE